MSSQATLLLQKVSETTVWSPICVFLLVASLYYQFFASASKSLDVPIFYGTDGLIGKEFCSSIQKASKEYRDRIFKLNTSVYETLILPTRYLNEIKALPESKLSFRKYLYEHHYGKYTLLGSVTHRGFIESVRRDFNKNLDATIPLLQDEVQYAVDSSIGNCGSWETIAVYPRVLRMVALLTGRLFVGKPLNRDEEWIQTSIQQTIDTFAAGYKLWTYHWAIRPFIAPFLPDVQRIRKQDQAVAKHLKPVISSRLNDLKRNDFSPPPDLIQFFLQNLPNQDPSYQARLHSAINAAAIHTTSMNVTNVIFDLANHPEYIPALRAEIEQAMEESNGVFNKNSLSKMWKMDSFLRESQRINPPAAVSLTRRTQSDVILSDGVLLPKGTSVAINSWGPTRDPQLWENPEEFDGFRFEKLRSQPGNESKYQVVSTGLDHLPFGHGTQSCPGRFLVANEIKILISHIIQHYDISFKAGSKRPESFYNGISIIPDAQAELLFKSRSKE